MIQKFLSELLVPKLIGHLTEAFKSYQNRQVSEAEIEAGVHKAVINAVASLDHDDTERIKAELKAEDWLTRNYRALLALIAFFPILFFAMFVPIAVDWLGMPPLRTGDLILKWCWQTSLAALGVLGIAGTVDLARMIVRLRR